MNSKTCRETIDLLLDLLEGRLPDGERADLEAHLAGCPPCVEFVNSYKATPGILRKALAVELPKDVADRLGTFLRDKRRPS
jgi:anti-sigma factor RsiW